MQKPESIQALISTIGKNKGSTYPAMSLVEKDPRTAAAISKLVRDTNGGQFDIKRRNAEMGLNSSQIQAISESIKARTKDNENIIQLFPDIELAVQILISSILSPKDMVKNELIYKTKEAVFPSEILTQLNEITQSEINGNYNLKEDLQTILRETLFDTGSHVRLVIPESIVDAMINETVSIAKESMVDIYDEGNNIRSLDFLGNSNTVMKKAPGGGIRAGLEAFFDNTKRIDYNNKVLIPNEAGKEGDHIALEHLEVTDNFQLLKIPELIKVGNRQKVKAKTKAMRSRARGFGAAMEAIGKKDGKLSLNELSQALYKDHNQDYEHLMVLPKPHATKRHSIGRPLFIKAPSEAVIPVIQTGNVKRRAGAFVIVDGDGNFLNKDLNKNESDGLAGLLANQSSNQNMSSLLIDKAKKNMVASNDAPTLDNITAVYGSIVETDLLERLNNGMYGSNVEIAGDQELYQIMLARALKGKMTRLIFVPEELMTYFAFKHYPNGVGKSYLDDVKNLTSIRAILMFAKVMAQVKSAINVTKVKVTFDPNDPDPEKTAEIIQHEIAKMRQMYFPLGINSPVDLTDWITRAGLEFEYENHPGVPDLKLAYETDNFKHEVPDSELDEALRKQTYMAFGLSPEIVDNGFNAEFATTAVQNNILLSKRVAGLQDIFTEQLTDLAVKICQNDQIIRDQYLEVLKNNKGLIEKNMDDEDKARYAQDDELFFDEMVERYLKSLSLELPRPDVTTLETQSEAFDLYEAAIEKQLAFIVSSEVASPELIGLVGDKMDVYKTIYKAYLMRQWAANNNYLPELNDLVQTNEDGKAVVDVAGSQKSHLEGLARSFIGFVKTMVPVKQAGDADLNKLGESETDPSLVGASSDSSSDTGGGEGGGEGGGSGGDEFGDFDLAPPPAPTEDEGEGGADKPADPSPDDDQEAT